MNRDPAHVDNMDAETLKALKWSISQWQSIVAGSFGDHAVENCPMCKLVSDPIPRPAPILIRIAAQAELELLRSFLPPGETA